MSLLQTMQHLTINILSREILVTCVYLPVWQVCELPLRNFYSFRNVSITNPAWLCDRAADSLVSSGMVPNMVIESVCIFGIKILIIKSDNDSVNSCLQIMTFDT